MADTAQSLSTLQTLLADNAAGDISAQDLRDFLVTSLMTTSAQSVTTSDVTAAIGIHYELTISGLTAERDFILPAASVGDRIRVKLVTDAPADYELVIKGAATVTINSGTAATEWSRLLIKDEVVEFRATSSTNWDVINDGRIECSAKMSLTSDATGKIENTLNKISLDNQVWDNGDIADQITNYRFNIRREGTYKINATAAVSLTTNGTVYCSVYKNGVESLRPARALTHSATSVGPANGAMEMALSAGDYLELYEWHTPNSQTQVSGLALGCAMAIREKMRT